MEVLRGDKQRVEVQADGGRVWRGGGLLLVERGHLQSVPPVANGVLGPLGQALSDAVPPPAPLNDRRRDDRILLGRPAERRKHTAKLGRVAVWQDTQRDTQDDYHHASGDFEYASWT
eukprot:6198491-Pleurochrysis_carterae.AAC.1